MTHSESVSDIVSITFEIMEKETLTISQALKLFGISKSTLERKITSGEIPANAIKKTGSGRVIEKSALIVAFGEPKEAVTMSESVTTHSDIVSESALVQLLKEQLAKAERIADEERTRADQERQRADRAFDELASERERLDKLTGQMSVALLQAVEIQRLTLTAPKDNAKQEEHQDTKKTGFFARFFGGN